MSPTAPVDEFEVADNCDCLESFVPECVDVEHSASPALIDLDPGEEKIKSSKIMIVDDEVFNVQVFRRHLESGGYSLFVTTSDSTKAVKMARSEHPDVILLDFMMPTGGQILT